MEYIKHALFINLKDREDRKINTINEFKELGIPIERFNAIKMDDGRIGCSMSHLACLNTAKKNDWDHVLIVEDDIQFLNPFLFKENLNHFLSSDIDWDVLLIAGNNIPPYQEVSPFCVKVFSCQTTTGYIVKKHYYDILINNIKEGISLLIREPSKHFYYAIDKYWFALQKKNNWYLLTPLTVIQREGYSDIEKRNTNYSSLLLDINKLKFFYKK